MYIVYTYLFLHILQALEHSQSLLQLLGLYLHILTELQHTNHNKTTTCKEEWKVYIQHSLVQTVITVEDLCMYTYTSIDYVHVYTCTCCIYCAPLFIKSESIYMYIDIVGKGVSLDREQTTQCTVAGYTPA